MQYITMPSDSGEVEGKVLEWYIREGQQAQRNIPIVNVVVGQTGISLKRGQGLYLRRIMISPHSTVPAGTILALIGTRDEPLPTSDVLMEDQARLQEMHRQRAHDDLQQRDRPPTSTFYRNVALIMSLCWFVALLLLATDFLQHHLDRIFGEIFTLLVLSIILTSVTIQWRQRVKEQV